MTTAWLAQRERGSTFALYLIVWIARALGRRVARAVLYPICAYFVCFSFAARCASRDYLRRVLGREPALREVFRHYHTFAAVVLDRVFLLSGRDEDFTISLDNEAAVSALFARREGCVLLSAHFGSFEVLRAIGQKCPGLEMRLAMYEANAKKISRIMAVLNPAATDMIIALGTPEAMLHISAALDRGAFVGMLADRLRQLGKRVRCDFLGAPASFPTGPLQVACALGRPVVLGFGVYVGDRRYAVQFESLVESWPQDRNLRAAAVEEAVRRYAARLEQHCREAPYNWFNFYDFWSEDAASR